MSKDRYERAPRRTRKQVKESVEMMANANFDAVPSLAEAMGLCDETPPPIDRTTRCLHGSRFPCSQCIANRNWNAAAGFLLTDEEFKARYVAASAAVLDARADVERARSRVSQAQTELQQAEERLKRLAAQAP